LRQSTLPLFSCDMAKSLIASDTGLQQVNDAREKLGWNRTDEKFLAAAGDISRATLNRFYAKQPIKHDNFVAICAAVGIKNWQRVANRVLSSEQAQVEVVAEIPATPLKELDRQLQDWFEALRYEIEENSRLETEDYFEWIIRIPVRSRFDRVLIHGIAGEPTMQDLARVERIVREKNLDEGCAVTDYRVGKSVAAYLAEEEQKGNHKILCLTVDELIDRDADFSPYIKWLESKIIGLGIDRDYLELNCSKPEKNFGTGKYLPPRADAIGLEKIDDYMDDWLNSNQKNHISVLGEFGTGKTWFAMHYAWIGIQSYQRARQERKKRPRFPLFITLRDHAKIIDVDTVIAGFFFVKHNIRLDGKVFDRLNRTGKLLIIFDGFDEMADKVDGQKAIDNFWALADVITESSKVILTCRTEHFPTTNTGKSILQGQELASTRARVAVAPKFETLNIHPFSVEQIKTVLTNRQATVETIDRILTHPQLFDLVKRPMMVDLVLAALPEINAGKTVDLARVFLYALKHQLAQNIKTERTFTSMADKLFFLCEVAWAMLSENALTLHYTKFPDRLRDVFGAAIEDRNLDHWHYDMMGQTILTRDDDGNYRPAHKSMLEFFVAFKLAAELGLLHPDFLELLREPVDRGDASVDTVDCKWSNYWQRCRQGAKIGGFQQENVTELVTTFGKSPLIPEVMNLLLAMVNMRVNYRQTNPLLELMQWTRGKDRQQVGWLGSNAGSAVVKLNPYGLEYQDLGGAILPDIDLVGAGLRAVNLTGAELSNAMMTKVFATCTAIATSDDGRFFFTGHVDGNVKIWSIDGQELFILSGHQGGVTALAVSGEWLFSGSDDRTVKQWQIETGECRRTLSGHQDWVTALAVSGEWLFSGSGDETVKQWQIETGECRRTLSGHQDWVRSLAVSGEWLFSGSGDETVKQWQIETGECRRTLSGHQYSVTALAVSGEWLFSGSDDRTVKQWQIETGECRRTLSGHQSWVTALAVSGEWLFSGSDDGTVKQWQIETGECVATLNNALCAGAKMMGVRGLTPAQIQSLQILGATID
jgi:predicted NACHT family NTPase